MAMLRKKAGGVNITPRTALNRVTNVLPASASATASYGLLNTGVLQLHGAGGVSGEWMTSGAVADYDVRFTATSGTTPSGVTYGTWLNLATSRVPSLTANRASGAGVGVTTVTGTITVEIRATGSGVVLDTESITITAEAELVL
jgi:hypothetical protein